MTRMLPCTDHPRKALNRGLGEGRRWSDVRQAASPEYGELARNYSNEELGEFFGVTSRMVDNRRAIPPMIEEINSGWPLVRRPVFRHPVFCKRRLWTQARPPLRAAGSDLRQNAELVEAVLATVRVAQPDAKDSALDARCAAPNVMQEISLLHGIGSPLFMRLAVRALNPP